MQEHTSPSTQKSILRKKIEERLLQRRRRSTLYTFFNTLATSVEAGMQRENDEEFEYAMAEDRVYANKLSLSYLHEGFIGKYSPLLTLLLDGSTTAATLDNVFSEMFGSAMTGSSFSQRDIFRQVNEESPDAKAARQAQTSQIWGDFLRRFPGVNEMSGLQMQLSTLLERDTGKYVVLVTRLRTAQRNMSVRRHETFLEATLYNRELVFGAIFDNPHDILDPSQAKFFQLARTQTRVHEGWKNNVFTAYGRIRIGQEFSQALGNPKYPDITTLGEHPLMQHMNHPMFISSESTY